jgi:magnesium-transporting ATPase (P-type)
MAKFKVLLAAKAKVYIDGQITEVNVESLVPGDVVHLEGGNKVPADVRLVECNGLKVELNFTDFKNNCIELKKHNIFNSVYQMSFQL